MHIAFFICGGWRGITDSRIPAVRIPRAALPTRAHREPSPQAVTAGGGRVGGGSGGWMAKEPTVAQKKITDYRPDPANPNAHSERGVGVLSDSIASVGLGRSIVVDKNGIVLAGNSTQERAVDQGFEDAIEVESDGTKLIVVRRNDLDLMNDTDNRARKLSYYDNRAAELGIQWDAEQLLADINAGVDLSKLFAPFELNAILEEINGGNDPNVEWSGMPEYEQNNVEAYRSIIVHFEDESAVQAFAELVKQTITERTKYIYYPEQEKMNLKQYRVTSES